MLKKGCVYLMGGVLLLAVMGGCGDNVSKAKGKKWEGSKITLETIFSKSFDSATWEAATNVTGAKVVETKFGMEEGLKNQVVVKGKISQALHEFALDKFTKGSKVAGFTEALRYAVKLNKDGKLANQPDANFDLKAFPVSETGEVDSDKAESFLLDPANNDKAQALLTFFKKKYWEPGTDVMLVLSLVARGAVIKIPVAKNDFWDNDVKFAGNNTTIMNILFEFAQSK
jgi:hypothetical protein